MKTLGVLLLLVVCVAAGSLENNNSKEKNSNIKEENNNSKVENSNIKEENNNSKEKIVELTKKNKHPTIIGTWLSHDGKISYHYLSDETWVEYLTTDKEHCIRYKTVAESQNGYKIITPLDEDKNKFFLAIGEDKVLYRKKTFEFIESKGKVESEGKWITLKRNCIMSKIICPALDYCYDKKCPGFKNAHCMPDQCKGCSAIKFVEKEVVVKCNKKPKSSQSKSDSKSNESKICKRPSNCFADPCHVQKKCNGFPGAKCKADYCKGCFAKWTLHGKVVKCKKTDDSSSHQKSSESKSCEFPVKCFHNPCKGKKCKGYRNAKCKPDKCKKCQAKWTVGNKVVQCKKESNESNNSNKSNCIPAVCKVNPCDMVKKCNGFKDAECKPDYCGGCYAKWYRNGKQVKCEEDSESNSKSNESKICKRPSNCFADPCHNQKKCNGFPGAKCKADYCKGCFAKWTLHGKEVKCKKTDDSSSHQKSSESKSCEFPVKCFHDPCKDKKCKGYRNAKCKRDNCGKCQAKWTVGNKVVQCKKDSKSQSKSNSKSHSKSNSKSNESKKCHKCKEDPCDNKKCHAFPKAKCVRDCKKCSAKWFHHSKEVSCKKDNGCPIIPPDSVGICIHQCDDDSECPHGKKCCRNACGGGICH